MWYLELGGAGGGMMQDKTSWSLATLVMQVPHFPTKIQYVLLGSHPSALNELLYRQQLSYSVTCDCTLYSCTPVQQAFLPM